jgi:hypothetical protein
VRDKLKLPTLIKLENWSTVAAAKGKSREMELSPAGRWADLPEDIALAVASRLQVGALSLTRSLEHPTGFSR